MTWYTDDRHLYWEQRRFDAQQAEAKEKMKMTDLDKIMGNLPSPEQIAQERAAARATHVAAVSAGLFATAADITGMMKEKGVNDGPEILLEGVAMFAAKLFDGVMQGTGSTPAEARSALEKAVRSALYANRRAMAEPATVQ